MHCSSDRTHDDEVVERLGLVPLVRQLSPQNIAILIGEHRQRFERGGVLRDQGALLDSLRILGELVRLRELLRVRKELFMGEPGERIRELRVEVLRRCSGGLVPLDERIAAPEGGLVARRRLFLVERHDVRGEVQSGSSGPGIGGRGVRSPSNVETKSLYRRYILGERAQ